jgi:hypothetical protein
LLFLCDRDIASLTDVYNARVPAHIMEVWDEP